MRVRVKGYEAQRPNYHPTDSDNLKWQSWLTEIGAWLTGEE